MSSLEIIKVIIIVNIYIYNHYYIILQYMAYYSKEIPEWSNKDLSSFFDTNNNRQIAEIIQSHSLIGFDLFYLNLNDLKTELGITGYHDRLMAYREIRKLTLEHCIIIYSSI